MDYYDHLIEIEENRALLENEKSLPGKDKSRRFFSVKDFILHHEMTRPHKTTRQDKTTQDKTTKE